MTAALRRGFILGILSAIYRVATLVALLALLANYFWFGLGVGHELVVLLGLFLLGLGFAGMRIWQLRWYLAEHNPDSVEPQTTNHGPVEADTVRAGDRSASSSEDTASMSGDPRLVAPELWARLSSIERHFAVKFYVKWVAEGRLDRSGDQRADAAVVIARRAIVFSVNLIAALISVLPFLALDYGIGGLVNGRTQAVISAVVFGSILLLIQIFAFRRRLRVKRYFAEHF